MVNDKSRNAVREAAVEFSRQYLVGVSWLYFISTVTIYNFIAGFVFLILRQMRFFSFDYVGFALAGLPVCLLLSVAMANRRKILPEKALAIVDSFNQAGGLAIASVETDDCSWNQRLPKSVKVPRLTTRFEQRLLLFAASLFFIIAGIKVPLYDFSRNENIKMDLKGMQEKALVQIETLEETGVIDANEAAELKETLEKMVKMADRNDPAKTFEAFDQLNEKILKEGQTAAQKAAQNLEELEQLKEQAQQLQNTDSANQNALKSAQNQLQNSFSASEASQQMPANMKNSINKGLEAVNSDGTPSAGEMKKAAQDLQNYIDQKIQEKRQLAEKLRNAMIIDRKTFEKMMKEGKIKPAGSMEDLKFSDQVYVVEDESGKQQQGAQAGESGQGGQNGESGQSGQSGQSGETGQSGQSGQSGESGQGGQSGQSGNDGGAGQNGNSLSGSGSISRGGGSAPLNFNRKSSEHNTSFKNEKLPDPSAVSLEDSVSIGMGVSAPTVEDNQASKATQSDPAAQIPSRSSGKNEVILPRHRNAVKKFFERQN